MQLSKKENIKTENMIYEIRDKQVILDNVKIRTKCHNQLYCDIITCYDMVELISVLFKYVPIKFRKEIKT